MDRLSSWTDQRPELKVITVEEFKQLLGSHAGDLLLLCNGLLELTPEQWTQRQLYHLYRSTSDLETLLDDHGARDNRHFFPMRELVAIARWLSWAMSSVVHLDSRISSYEHADSDWSRDTLAPQVRETGLVLGRFILETLEALRRYWISLGLQWPDGALRVDSLAPGGPRLSLPRDLSEPRDASQESERSSEAARLVAHYLGLWKRFHATRPRRVEGLEELREVVARYCTEEQCRSFEARIHNLQSSYDSLVAGSQEELQHPELRILRGSVSQALHLFEAVTALSHLYHRHELSDCPGAAGRVLLDEEELLDMIVNRCIISTYKALERSVPVAETLLQGLTHQTSAVFAVPEGVTLHARPISLIVSIVNRHDTPVEVHMGGDNCSAASIMQMMVLAGSHPGERSLEFRGDVHVLEDLQALFDARLGEDGLHLLPDRLEYLKP